MTWTMPWVSLPKRVERDAEVAAVGLELRDLLRGLHVHDREAARRRGRPVVGGRDGLVRPPDADAAGAEARERLRARDLVDEVEVDREDGGRPLVLRDDVVVPDLLDECSRVGHRGCALLRLRGSGQGSSAASSTADEPGPAGVHHGPDERRARPRGGACQRGQRIGGVGRVGRAELACEVGGDGPRGARAADDEELVDARLGAEVVPALPARETRGFRSDHRMSCSRRRSSDWSSVAMAMCARCSWSRASIHHGSGRCDGDLGEGVPSGIDRLEQRLQHSRLVAVADEGSGVRVEPDAKVGAEHEPESHQRLVGTGAGRPSSIRPRYGSATPAARATATRLRPASSRSRRISSPSGAVERLEPATDRCLRDCGWHSASRAAGSYRRLIQASSCLAGRRNSPRWPTSPCQCDQGQISGVPWGEIRSRSSCQGEPVASSANSRPRGATGWAGQSAAADAAGRARR